MAIPDTTALKIGAVVVVGLTVVAGFYQVEQAEEAVVLRFGKYHMTETAGLHWAMPLVDEVKKVNIQKVEQIPLNARMITEDTNIVEISLTVQYRILEPVRLFAESVRTRSYFITRHRKCLASCSGWFKNGASA
ncbi:MAG: hypothetical protein IPL02_07855 [Moraxellaceae bacterium]|nr:hypothetical protein [Moraxellaceae bacterium]